MSVTMVISGVILTVLAMMFVSSLRQNRTVTGKTNSTSSARIDMEALRRALRVAISPVGTTPAFITAGPIAVSFYASIGTSTGTTDPVPSLVAFSLVTTTPGACLRRSVTPGVVTSGVVSWPGSGTRTNCVARGLINADGSPLFSYYPLPVSPTVEATALPMPSGQVAAASLPNIAAVDIALSVTDQANGGVPPSVVNNRISITNNVYQLQQGGS